MANIPKSRENTYPAKPTTKNSFAPTWIHFVSGVVMIAAIAVLGWLDANNGDKYDYWIYIALVAIAYYCYVIPRAAHKDGKEEAQ